MQLQPEAVRRDPDRARGREGHQERRHGHASVEARQDGSARAGHQTVGQLDLGGTKVWQIGIPIHWGYVGIAAELYPERVRALARQRADAVRRRRERANARDQSVPGPGREERDAAVAARQSLAGAARARRRARASAGPLRPKCWASIARCSTCKSGVRRARAARARSRTTSQPTRREHVLPRVIEVSVAHGPPALQQGVLERFRRARFRARSIEAWLRGEPLDAVDRFLARAAAAPVLEALGPRRCALARDASERSHLPGLRRAAAAQLLRDRRRKTSSRRTAIWSARAARRAWAFPRMTCAACGETEHRKLLDLRRDRDAPKPRRSGTHRARAIATRRRISDAVTAERRSSRTCASTAARRARTICSPSISSATARRAGRRRDRRRSRSISTPKSAACAKSCPICWGFERHAGTKLDSSPTRASASDAKPAKSRARNGIELPGDPPKFRDSFDNTGSARRGELAAREVHRSRARSAIIDRQRDGVADDVGHLQALHARELHGSLPDQRDRQDRIQHGLHPARRLQRLPRLHLGLPVRRDRLQRADRASCTSARSATTGCRPT